MLGARGGPRAAGSVLCQAAFPSRVTRAEDCCCRCFCTGGSSGFRRGLVVRARDPSELLQGPARSWEAQRERSALLPPRPTSMSPPSLPPTLGLQRIHLQGRPRPRLGFPPGLGPRVSARTVPESYAISRRESARHRGRCLGLGSSRATSEPGSSPRRPE